MPSYLTPDNLLINSFGNLDLYHDTNPPADGVDINGRLNVNLLTIDGMEDGFIEKPSSFTSGNIPVFNATGDCVDSGFSVSDVSILTDDTTSIEYKFGINNGLLYIEEV